MQMIPAERHDLLGFFPPAVQTLYLVGKLLQSSILRMHMQPD